MSGFNFFFRLVLIIVISSCSNDNFFNTDITGAKFGQDFSLISHKNQKIQLDDFKGKVLILFFGFTNCPDICPTTLIKIKEILDTLDTNREDFRVAFVTVDPLNDTPNVLMKYLINFDENFIGLTGTEPQIEKVVKEFKIFRQKVKIKDSKIYTFDHTAGFYVFDKNSKIRLYIKQNSKKEEIIKDLLILLRQ